MNRLHQIINLRVAVILAGLNEPPRFLPLNILVSIEENDRSLYLYYYDIVSMKMFNQIDFIYSFDTDKFLALPIA